MNNLWKVPRFSLQIENVNIVPQSKCSALPHSLKSTFWLKTKMSKMHFPKMTFACGQALLVALLDNVNQSHLNEKLSNMWMILQVLSLSCFLRCSRILISSCACRWNLFSFLTILRATCWWVLWSYTLSTWPNEPLPITFRISYLRWKMISHFFSYLLQYCHLWKRWWGMKKRWLIVNWRWRCRLWMKRRRSGTLDWLSLHSLTQRAELEFVCFLFLKVRYAWLWLSLTTWRKIT